MMVKWTVPAAAAFLLMACGTVPPPPKDPPVVTSGAEQAVPHGIARVFAANVGDVRSAVLRSLMSMDMKVVADSKTTQGWRIMALADERMVLIQLESVTPTVTRMRVIVDRSGGWDDKGIEVVLRALDALAPGREMRPA
ncbi:MAG TPA: hypothetical protein VMQ11_15260 [Alphaproteobacteria bacterium]|nr:hypothetical protein [Alphaproteobacteria bacterium]